MMTFTAEELAQRDVKAFRDFKSQEAKRRIQRKPWSEMKFKEQFEFAFVRFTLTMSGGFVLLGVVSSLCLSGLLFSMGMKEVMFDAVTAWMNYNPVAGRRAHTKLEFVLGSLTHLTRFFHLFPRGVLAFSRGSNPAEMLTSPLGDAPERMLKPRPGKKSLSRDTGVTVVEV
jgi:hypothetical protein